MRGAWIAVLAACFMLAAPVEAAELTGFGPIKFGMSKVEAWEAIGGQGKWEPDDQTKKVLVYKYPFLDTEEYWVVRQLFTGDQAGGVRTWYGGPGVSPKSCRVQALGIATKIGLEYGALPTIRSDDTSVSYKRDGQSRFEIFDIYRFELNNKKSVRILMAAFWGISSPLCDITVDYTNLM